jgi:FlaA1/EpsC-like NDP-sugar epimerase
MIGGVQVPPLEGKRIVVTGGTGSLGQAVVRRLLDGEQGHPSRVTVFSRDEAKQHAMRLAYREQAAATDEVIYGESEQILGFRIGDVRDYASVLNAIRDAHVVIHAAALKQVPTCEYFPYQAFMTNVLGARNLVRAIREHSLNVEAVVGISTDKACKPVNVMGLTKAIMERVLVAANLDCPKTRLGLVRYGNVIASRGSVIPLFMDQIARGGPITVTRADMTRFLMTMDQAVDTVVEAAVAALPGEIYIPKVKSARIVDLARVLSIGRSISVEFRGVRPGEKIHEVLISEEELFRTLERDGYYVIRPMLPELGRTAVGDSPLSSEYSSAEVMMNEDELRQLLAPFVNGVRVREVL